METLHSRSQVITFSPGEIQDIKLAQKVAWTQFELIAIAAVREFGPVDFKALELVLERCGDGRIRTARVIVPADLRERLHAAMMKMSGDAEEARASLASGVAIEIVARK